MYCNCDGVEEPQVEAETAPEDAYDSIVTVLKDTVTNEVKQHVQNTRIAIPELMEEPVEQLLQAAALNAHGEIRTVMYPAVKQVT